MRKQNPNPNQAQDSVALISEISHSDEKSFDPKVIAARLIGLHDPLLVWKRKLEAQGFITTGFKPQSEGDGSHRLYMAIQVPKQQLAPEPPAAPVKPSQSCEGLAKRLKQLEGELAAATADEK